MTSAIEKYLSRYAEPEAAFLATASTATAELPSIKNALTQHSGVHFESCLVIPAYNESLGFIERLKQHPHISHVLLILVINQPENSESAIKNQQLFNTLTTPKNIIATDKNIAFIQTGALRALIVDRFSETNRIPIKQGVGLARKIGADIACQLYVDGLIKDNKSNGQWIFSTDADAHLPHNYFNIGHIKSDLRVFNFHHIKNPSEISSATGQYEQALKYYQKALEWSGSPYAFYALGSVLAFQVDAYSKVRGFPKRSAGEDFYLLNKLIKQGRVTFDPSITVQIEPRISDRVPFGTGPAVKAIIEKNKDNEEYTYYNPEIFTLLKTWIRWATTQLPNACLSDQNNASNWKELIQGSLPDTIIDTIDSLKFEEFVNHASHQCRTNAAFIEHFHNWFDGFKTLKFIHYLQRYYHPAIPINECIKAHKNWEM
ncbi:MAG: hypothetical protein K6L81_13140 [Agarilytica sp.]